MKKPKMEKEIWEGNIKKYLSKNPVMRFLNNKFKKDIINRIQELGPNKIKTILDVGCGEGFITYEIAKNFPESKILGIDPGKEYIEYAKRFNALSNADFKQGEVDSLNEGHQFDLIILTEVLEHLPNPKEALSKILKSAKNYVLFSVPNEPFFRIGNFCALKYMGRLGNPPGHLHNWTKNQLTKILKHENLDFKIKTSTFWNIVLIRK